MRFVDWLGLIDSHDADTVEMAFWSLVSLLEDGGRTQSKLAKRIYP